MKFSTKQDIDAPADFVFEQLTDFEGWERQAARRDIKVKRNSPKQGRAVGAGWTIEAMIRGKLREIEATVITIDEPNQVVLKARTAGLNMTLEATLIPLSEQRTRMAVGLELKPQTLPARVIIQSIKFAKASLQRRFENRVNGFGLQVTEKYLFKARRGSV